MAVAAETPVSPGYVAKAIWLAMHSEPQKKKKKIPLFNGDKREPGYLDIVYSQRAAHIKRLLWIFVP